MTARTTGRQPRPGRPAGAAAATKRPAKRPANAGTTTPGTPSTTTSTTASGMAVDGTAALKAVPTEVHETDDVPAAAAAQSAPVPGPTSVPPIDARILLHAIMTPPGGLGAEGLTDALSGAVPTWRLDEEPIYLEVVRDLGVPALPDDDGGTGEVIVGEVVG